ncbi:MAG: hypothetical protein AAGF74_02420 [Pseudomonadota bacterium]
MSGDSGVFSAGMARVLADQAVLSYEALVLLSAMPDKTSPNVRAVLEADYTAICGFAWRIANAIRTHGGVMPKDLGEIVDMSSIKRLETSDDTRLLLRNYLNSHRVVAEGLRFMATLMGTRYPGDSEELFFALQSYHDGAIKRIGALLDEDGT